MCTSALSCAIGELDLAYYTVLSQERTDLIPGHTEMTVQLPDPPPKIAAPSAPFWRG